MKAVTRSVGLSATWLLAGWFGAAIVTWFLESARTYVLAWASEWVSADLRNKTYEHLQWLSRRVLRRQADRRSDVADRQRHGKDLQFPVDQSRCFRLRCHDDVMTAAFLLCDRPALGSRVAGTVSGHCLACPLGPLTVAAKLSLVGSRLGRDDERAGRHDSGHPRRQGLRAGKTRDRAIRPS